MVVSVGMQLRLALMYPNSCNLVLTLPGCEYPFDMLKIARLAMLRLTNMGNHGRKRWCTAIVLLAVCTLTVSVATRYSVSPSATNKSHAVVEADKSWTGLQRLLNNAATWMPPLVEAEIFHDPGYYPHVARSRPPVLTVLLEKNLYNRPPPSASFLS